VALLLWTNIFGTLGIGGCLRRFLTGSDKSPDILSLPLAVLVFAIVVCDITALFTTYGLFSSAIQACRNKEMVLLSYCGVARLEGFYFAFLSMVLLISIGMTLSTESPLIRACSTYRHAATLKLIIGLGVAAVVIGALIEPLLSTTDWYQRQTILGFAIAAIFLFLVLLAASLFMFVQRIEQLSNAFWPTLDRSRPVPQRKPVNEVNDGQSQARNVRSRNSVLDAHALKDAITGGRPFQRRPLNEVKPTQAEASNIEPGKQYVNSDLDVQALKEAIKKRRRYFEQ
jgi:hypothetical protein